MENVLKYLQLYNYNNRNCTLEHYHCSFQERDFKSSFALSIYGSRRVYSFCVCICSLNRESIVDIEGVVTAAPEVIKSCTQSKIEIKVEKVRMGIKLIICVSRTDQFHLLPIDCYFYVFCSYM